MTTEDPADNIEDAYSDVNRTHVIAIEIVEELSEAVSALEKVR